MGLRPSGTAWLLPISDGTLSQILKLFGRMLITNPRPAQPIDGKQRQRPQSKNTICMLGNLFMLLTFSKLTFSKKSFGNTIRVSNGLDPDQDRCHVGPDLGPNCLQSYQQTSKVPASKEGDKVQNFFYHTCFPRFSFFT